MKYIESVSTVDKLCQVAELEKQCNKLSAFLYMRALGGNKQGIGSELGVTRHTLARWENKLAKNLNPEQRHRLVTASVSKEFAERIGGR